jgi:hypothetical protein
LYQYRSRSYDPKIGQFLSRDVEFFDTLGLYTYVVNNPLLFVDPLGYRVIHNWSILGGRIWAQFLIGKSVDELMEGECTTITARGGGNIPPEWIAKFIPAPALLVAVVAWQKLGGLLKKVGIVMTANLQLYLEGNIEVCKKCNELCAEKCEISLGARLSVNFNILKRIVAGGWMALSAGWDVCKGDLFGKFSYAASARWNWGYPFGWQSGWAVGNEHKLTGEGWMPAPLAHLACPIQ